MGLLTPFLSCLQQHLSLLLQLLQVWGEPGQMPVLASSSEEGKKQGVKH